MPALTMSALVYTAFRKKQMDGPEANASRDACYPRSYVVSCAHGKTCMAQAILQLPT